MNALTGVRGAVVRVTEKGELIVSVAVPIQRFRAVLGVLLLSTQAGDIDKIVHAERLASCACSASRAGQRHPVAAAVLDHRQSAARLSAAAIRVRRGSKEREEIPDFSSRQDEIGNLSIALRDMTTALYDRIDAIESFAADVSHELKNPLTSLRSAVETLPLAKSDDSKKRLMDVIQHDVRRLDRLISDISDASRLDAELARVDAGGSIWKILLRDLVDISRQIRSRKKEVQIEFAIERKPGVKTRFLVNGHDLRIGQIITNLIENARSFVPTRTARSPSGWSGPGHAASSISKTMVPASRPKTSTASSSASTPTGRTPRVSARIPASVSRSAGRSPKPMAAR
jgi:two-component system sensor histidine kinase ChvG